MKDALRFALLLLTTAAVASGCTGSDTEPTSYAEMLRWIPNEPEYRRQIWMTDYDAVRALPPVDSASTADSPLHRLNTTTLERVGVSIVPPFGSNEALAWPEIPEHWELGFGFAIGDIQRTLATTNFGSSSDAIPGFDRLGIVAGNFDSNGVSDRLAACAGCEPGEARTHAGRTYYHWSADISREPEQRLKPPILDNLGRGGNIALTDDHILFDLHEQTLQLALETRRTGGSVMDIPSFRLLAEELENRSFVTFMLGDETLGPEWRAMMLESGARSSPPEWYTAMFSAPFDPPLLGPYDALAIGWGQAAGERYATVLLAHETVEQAEDNMPRLGARLEQTRISVCSGAGDCDQIAWSDAVTSWDVETKGRLLIATLHGGSSQASLRLGASPLLLHE